MLPLDVTDHRTPTIDPEILLLLNNINYYTDADIKMSPPAAHAQQGQAYASDSPSQQAAEMSVVLCTAGCE